MGRNWETISEEDRKAEENCFQWLEDLRVLFIEGEDEQRATIPLNEPTIEHGNKNQTKLQDARKLIKSVGLQLKGLDSKSIADICKGKENGGTDKITFALYGKEDKLIDFAKSKQSWYSSVINTIKQNYNYGKMKAFRVLRQISGVAATLFGSVYALSPYGSGTDVDHVVGLMALLLGFAIFVTNAPKLSKQYTENVVKALEKELGKATQIDNIDIMFIENEKNYEFRIIVQRNSLLKVKTDALAKPTVRTNLKF